MELTITIFDVDALVTALQAVEAAESDPSRIGEALSLARDVLSSLTVMVEGAEEDRAVEQSWLGWVR